MGQTDNIHRCWPQLGSQWGLWRVRHTFFNSIFLGQTFVRTKFCSRPLKGKISLTFIGFVLRGIQNQASNMQNFMKANFCLTYYRSMLPFYALWKYCNVFSRYRKGTLAWNGLISQLTNNVSFVGILSEWVNIYSLVGAEWVNIYSLIGAEVWYGIEKLLVARAESPPKLKWLVNWN